MQEQQASRREFGTNSVSRSVLYFKTYIPIHK